MCELEYGFPGNVSFLRIVLDVDVDDVYWAIVVSASRQEI